MELLVHYFPSKLGRYLEYCYRIKMGPLGIILNKCTTITLSGMFGIETNFVEILYFLFEIYLYFLISWRLVAFKSNVR